MDWLILVAPFVIFGILCWLLVSNARIAGNHPNEQMRRRAFRRCILYSVLLVALTGLIAWTVSIGKFR